MKIFISYRRDDSAGYAGRLFDRLTAHFKADQVFMDIDTIQPGEDFRKAIENAVGTCDVVLVMIGKQWLHATNSKGQRRLDDARDWVRAEVASALVNPKVRVIPVLVRDAGMPGVDELPADLKELSWRNAIELSDNRFQYDANRLIEVIEQLEEGPSKRAVSRLPKLTARNLGGIFLTLAILGIVFWAVGTGKILTSLSGSPAPTVAVGAPSPAEEMPAMPSSETSPVTDLLVPTGTSSPAVDILPTPTSPVTKYFDNFKYGIDSTIWQVNLNDWNSQNERVSAAQIYRGAKMFTGDLTWQDYQVTVNTSSSDGERKSYLAAVYVRYQDEDNFVQFVFDCDYPTSTILWQYKQHGNLTEINTTKRELSTCKWDPYLIRLTVRGTKYEASMDGEIAAFSLDLFQNGLVGLYSGENGGGVSAAFDNFLIEP